MKPLKYKSVFHIYLIFFILLITMIATGFGMLIYNITLIKPDGQFKISKWPIDFTQEFSHYIVFTKDGVPLINQPGLKLLQDNNLWVQIIDTNGDEIQTFDKPSEILSHHSPSSLINLYQNGTEKYSVFFGSVQWEDREWTYLIGFPLPISKIILHVNRDRFKTFKPIVFVILCIMLLVLVLSTFIYGFIMARQIKKIRQNIRAVASRTYIPTTSNDSFSEIYEELNTLNSEIKSTDEARAKDEKLREEWITNITHDLKTPLSPIKGYAELISTLDSEIEPYELRRYGYLLLKNTAYAEGLINDLKLTYQLKNQMLPLSKHTQNIVRFTKELLVDLLNNPEFELRDISFYSSKEIIEFSFDEMLLKRALNNLLTNALIHNNADTHIFVSIKVENGIIISIQDDGYGMNQEELDNLFVRYYRGENTTAKPEGSGLGMAIARQIIELHDGSISARSEIKVGTCITIKFLAQN